MKNYTHPVFFLDMDIICQSKLSDGSLLTLERSGVARARISSSNTIFEGVSLLGELKRRDINQEDLHLVDFLDEPYFQILRRNDDLELIEEIEVASDNYSHTMDLYLFKVELYKHILIGDARKPIMGRVFGNDPIYPINQITYKGDSGDNTWSLNDHFNRGVSYPIYSYEGSFLAIGKDDKAYKVNFDSPAWRS